MSDRTTCITNAGYIRFVKRIIYIGWGCRIVYVMESYTPPDPRCKSDHELAADRSDS